MNYSVCCSKSMELSAMCEFHTLSQCSAQNNVQQLAILWTFHLFVQTKLHLTGQIV